MTRDERNSKGRKTDRGGGGGVAKKKERTKRGGKVSVGGGGYGRSPSPYHPLTRLQQKKTLEGGKEGGGAKKKQVLASVATEGDDDEGKCVASSSHIFSREKEDMCGIIKGAKKQISNFVRIWPQLRS